MQLFGLHAYLCKSRRWSWWSTETGRVLNLHQILTYCWAATKQSYRSLSVTAHRPSHCNQLHPHWVVILLAHKIRAQCTGHKLLWVMPVSCNGCIDCIYDTLHIIIILIMQYVDILQALLVVFWWSDPQWSCKVGKESLPLFPLYYWCHMPIYRTWLTLLPWPPTKQYCSRADKK